MNKKTKSPAEVQQEVRAPRDQIKRIHAEAREPIRKPVNIYAIILLMSAVWGLYGLDLYFRHHSSRWHMWYLMLLSLAFALGWSGFLLYCLKKGKVYIRSMGIGRGQWVFRNADPFIYRFYIAIYLVGDGAIIYTLITLLPLLIKSSS